MSKHLPTYGLFQVYPKTKKASNGISYRLWLIGQSMSAGHSPDEAVRRADAVIEQLDKEQELLPDPRCTHAAGYVKHMDDPSRLFCRICGEDWKA